MEFLNIAGHVSVIHHLQSAFKNNRIPSAYLFTGLQGIGKATLAKAFVQMLNCDTHNNCHQCDSCRMVERDGHPDFITIEPDGKFIKIKQIQTLIKQLDLKPVYAKKRVVLLENVHQMNVESANCFLKILEEPPLDTLLILLTTDANLLLETIVSRVQKVQFAPLSEGHLLSILQQQYELKAEDLAFVMNYAHGRIRSDWIRKLSQLLNMRTQVREILGSLVTERMVDHVTLLEQWNKQDLGAYFLEFCTSWLRDWIWWLEEKPHRLINSDLLEDFATLPPKVTIEQLHWAFDLTIETELAIKAQAGKQLALEGLIIQIKQIFSGKIVV